ncbi:MAG TPA: NADH-quinone oxidoreductase subunit NuoK [Opitutales bacterium]|nr:NADH-quinone oxidoreductase subunit NuoK [Opitutales bacterium]
MHAISLNHYLIVAALLFAIGFAGVLVRRNLIIVLMCLELMLNAANIALVAFSRYNATPARPMMDGNAFVFFVITVAAAEVAVGLAIVVALFRRRGTVMTDDLTALKK